MIDIPQLPEIKPVYELTLDDLVATLNQVGTIFNPLTDEEKVEFPSILTNEQVFNLFFGFELIYQTEVGKPYEEKLVNKDSLDILYAGVYYELGNRIGIPLFKGEDYLIA